MQSRAKLFGHAVHPMLVVFPLGLLVTSFIFDVIHLATGNSTWALASFYMIGAGVVGGVAAAVPGLIDWIAIPGRTRAKSVGLWHALGNVVVLALFAISWLARRAAPGAPPVSPIVLSLIGVGIGVITAWLGGEMVERLAIGVDDGAHADAPSSLDSNSVPRTRGAA